MNAKCARCGHGDGRSIGHGPVPAGRAFQCESYMGTGDHERFITESTRDFPNAEVAGHLEIRRRCPCPGFVREDGGKA